ncbi:hypothetical protein MVEN_01811700 [Mycena venus]|uniref:Uncharacterized protein n=1 Tax=Mycena venus TaxID=2733690 RepID=A0A8H7CNB1_9AGAR|nr:hypothetical protein MVEN_01811700 [Mycena venus]
MTGGFGPLPLAENHPPLSTQAGGRILGPRWMHLPTLTIGLLGVQILWSVEMSYAPPYLLSLGLHKPSMAIVFLAGPLSGLFVQPLIGVLADNSTSRWGRRRPYMLAGCAICAASMLLLGYTREVAAVFTGRGNATNDVVTVWLAVLAIYLMDFSINAVQAVDRALLVDTLPPSLQASGNAWAASMLGLGSLVGFFIGNLNLPELLPFLGSSEMQVLSVLVVLLVVTGHLATAVLVRGSCSGTDRAVGLLALWIWIEVPNRHSNHRPSFRAEIQQIWESMWTLPRVIQQICMIQFFAWLGWFPILFYTTVYISDLHARTGTPAVSDAAAEGTRLGSRALFFSAALTLLTNLVLPAFTSTTSSSKSNIKTCVPKIPLVAVWAGSHLLFGACMLATFAVSSVEGATWVIAITGVSWAITQWAPFALLAEAILTSEPRSTANAAAGVRVGVDRDADEGDSLLPRVDEEPTQGGDANADPIGPGDVDDQLDRLDMRSSVPTSPTCAVHSDGGLSAQAGVILGIHNVCIVIPQFLVTILCALAFALFDATDDASPSPPTTPQTFEPEKGNPSAVVYVFRDIACLEPPPSHMDGSTSAKGCPTHEPQSSRTNRAPLHAVLAGFLFFVAGWLTVYRAAFPLPSKSPVHGFYTNISRPHNICPGVRGDSSSYAGYIGLAEDTAEKPRRSFFWFFEAEEGAENAPIMQVLTFGGGPGATAMLQPFTGQGPCLITPNGTKPNINRITERFNLLALEHPVGTGFSYGRMVNNSYDGALDVYDFLQKFFILFPHFSKNRLIISSESSGGTYIPHIATVIHRQNKLRVETKRTSTAHINLDSLDALSHYRWSLYHRCVVTDVYDNATCTKLYGILPACLEGIEASLQNTGMSSEAMAARRAAEELCFSISRGGVKNGTFLFDMRLKCFHSNRLDCIPRLSWMDQFFRDVDTKNALGVPHSINFSALTPEVADGFDQTGDYLLPAHLLYEPLLSEGIRVLHLAGAQDAMCPWPGILSFLKLLRTPFQDAFRKALDVPWPPANLEMATVRSVGTGAGNMSYILVADAGHFVSHDQPRLFKEIMEHWIDNSPFV